jgi:hypothetical protein
VSRTVNPGVFLGLLPVDMPTSWNVLSSWPELIPVVRVAGVRDHTEQLAIPHQVRPARKTDTIPAAGPTRVGAMIARIAVLLVRHSCPVRGAPFQPRKQVAHCGWRGARTTTDNTGHVRLTGEAS